MFYIIIFIAFASLFTLILIYNALLVFVNERRAASATVQKIATVAFIASLMPSGAGLWYASKLFSYGVFFEVPRRFETLQTLLADWYTPLLFAAPILIAVFLLSINKNHTLSLWTGSVALLTETAILLSTLLV